MDATGKSCCAILIILYLQFTIIKQCHGACNKPEFFQVQFPEQQEGTVCQKKYFKANQMVCVCNSTYCNKIASMPEHIPNNTVYYYESNVDGKRMELNSIQFNSVNNATAVKCEDGIYEILIDQVDQEICGFGGAFTDACGINLKSLSEDLQNNLIEDYYGAKGSMYTIGRVPMGSCDFSTHSYSYDDLDGDFSLKNFSLAYEDYNYKIPFIQRAIHLCKEAGNELKLFTSPWSAPPWMKSNGKFVGIGHLKGDISKPNGDTRYFETWAQYFVKFFDEYKNNGIDFWACTVQNEPTDGYNYFYIWFGFIKFETMGYTAEQERDFVKKILGPVLLAAYPNVKIIIVDDMRNNLPSWPNTILGDAEAARYVSGVGFHWYLNGISPPSVLDEVRKKSYFEGKFLLSTEACSGAIIITGVKLGDWGRAEDYFKDIMDDLDHGTCGWTDWNLCLDEQGGPNWVKNYVDAAIIVNTTGNEYYKQPMYYALAHFSKCLKPKTTKVAIKVVKKNSKLRLLSFVTPEGSRVLIVFNKDSQPTTFSFMDSAFGTFKAYIPGHAFQTFKWNRE